MKDYQQVKSKLLKDKELRKAYEELGPEFALVEMIIAERLKQGLTQDELARRLGTRQSAISRLERGVANPTISFLKKVAVALRTSLVVSLERH